MMGKEMHARLFVGPGCASFEEAKATLRKLKEEGEEGKKPTFTPIHGRIAGYHIEPIPGVQTPVLSLNPPLAENGVVTILDLHRATDISIALIPKSPGELNGDETGEDLFHKKFFPEISAFVEYESA